MVMIGKNCSKPENKACKRSEMYKMKRKLHYGHFKIQIVKYSNQDDINMVIKRTSEKGNCNPINNSPEQFCKNILYYDQESRPYNSIVNVDCMVIITANHM